MTQHYVATRQTTAIERAQDDGREGYIVTYEDGFPVWIPKEVFEASYMAAYVPVGDIGNLPPHVQRVIGEKAQNDDRLAKLNSYIASPDSAALSDKSRELLVTQASAMGELSEIFAERIANF